MKRGDLVERPEIGDRRTAAKGDDHSTVDPLCERITSRCELALRDLRCCDVSSGHRKNCELLDHCHDTSLQPATSSQQPATIKASSFRPPAGAPHERSSSY